MNFVKFMLSQLFFDILFLDISWSVAQTPIKHTIFWGQHKFAENALFWVIQEPQLRKEKRKLDKWPHFSIYFLSSNCLWHSFVHLKIVKIHFHGVPSLVYSGLQNTWILGVKAVRLWFCFIWFRSIHIEESKKTGFTFSIELRINSKIFRVISWSK